jgi:hypothetical protein
LNNFSEMFVKKSLLFRKISKMVVFRITMIVTFRFHRSHF